MTKRRCLIIGATGFLGAHLRSGLAEVAEFEIVTCDSRTMDLRQRSAVKEFIALQKPDIIVNLAGISSPASDDISRLYEINAFGHLYVVEAAAALKQKPKVILASSAQVYGPGTVGKATERTPSNPVSHYALSKLLAEKYNELFAEGMSTVTVRIYNAIGRGQSTQFLISKIVAAFKERAPELEIGLVDVERDFIDARDLNQMWRLLMRSDDVPAIVNFSNGETVTLRNIILRLSAMTKHNMVVKSNSSMFRKNDIPYQCGDNTVIQRLGYKRRYTLDDTLLWMLQGTS